MKAMILETYGPDATFVAVEREIPKAATGQVLVKVAATRRHGIRQWRASTEFDQLKHGLDDRG